MSATPLVGIVMGSDSDWPIMRQAAVTLKNLGIPYEAKVLSAHRTPDEALAYAETASDRGMKPIWRACWPLKLSCRCWPCRCHRNYWA
jgi:5-(carboxyamino)imidazole ribonucleotide mutase